MAFLSDHPLKVMLDNAIVSHADFGKPTLIEQKSQWGDMTSSELVAGVVLKPPHPDKEYQDQMNALFTIGRLIRCGQVRAFTYSELRFEKTRGRPSGCCNALNNCRIEVCASAIERSKLGSTLDTREMMAKGGTQDWKKGIGLGNHSQIAFLIWLYELGAAGRDLFLLHATKLGLTEFEIESLRSLALFKSLCDCAQSSENYPDMFHIWTTERNSLDVFLTLEKSMPQIIQAAKVRKKDAVNLKVEVLRPVELLRKLGISKPDEVPLETGKFYHYHELPPEFC
jgi:hypothetical protein